MKFYVKDGYVFAATEQNKEIAMAPIKNCVTVRDIMNSVERNTIAADTVKHGMMMEAIRAKSVFIPAR